MPDMYGRPTEAELRGQTNQPATDAVPWSNFNTFTIPQSFGGVKGHNNLRGPQTVTTSGSLQDWAHATLRGDTVLQGTDSRNGRAYATLDPNRYFYAHEVLGKPLSDEEKNKYIEAYTYERHATEKPPDWMTKNGKYVALAALAAIGGAGAAGAGGAGGAAVAPSTVDAGVGATVGAAAPATGVIGGATGAVGGATAVGGAGELAGGIGAAGAAAGSAGSGVGAVGSTAGSSALGADAGGLQQTSGLGYFANGGQGGMAGVGGGNTGELAASNGISGGSGVGSATEGGSGGGVGWKDYLKLGMKVLNQGGGQQGGQQRADALRGKSAELERQREEDDRREQERRRLLASAIQPQSYSPVGQSGQLSWV